MCNPITVTDHSDPTLAKTALSQDLVFGKIFADLMFTARHDEVNGWHDAKIAAFQNLSISPAAKVFHYGLEIFEGHKVYRQNDGGIALFRPRLNALRLNRSASRMCLPEVPVDLQMEAVFALVGRIKAWVPEEADSSLYLRPTLIGVESALGIKPSREHLYFIIASPVGPYFKSKAASVTVRVEDETIRAAEGGSGFAKAGGNYGGGMMGKKRALDNGFDEVLWLDAKNRRTIEELGGMNAFVVKQGMLITPPLSSTILDGITRRSVLELASHLGIPHSEESIDINEMLLDIEKGRITEVMAVGTAAVITPVSRIGYKDRVVELQDGFGPVARRLYQTLTDIQYGRSADPFGWMVRV
jgi:branched-chain amino acid aminotransferase